MSLGFTAEVRCFDNSFNVIKIMTYHVRNMLKVVAEPAETWAGNQSHYPEINVVNSCPPALIVLRLRKKSNRYVGIRTVLVQR
jgi:hypothetical protein